jgi:hypothetical protein
MLPTHIPHIILWKHVSPVKSIISMQIRALISKLTVNTKLTRKTLVERVVFNKQLIVLPMGIIAIISPITLFIERPLITELSLVEQTIFNLRSLITELICSLFFKQY